MVEGGCAIRFLNGCAALALASVVIGASAGEMRALVWIAPGQEFEALARQPATCLASGSEKMQLRTGKALFNSPQLLGGQAARASISCESCHSNGQLNRHFFLDGVSDRPGNADVSSSFFSLARANHRFDPKPIPNLAEPGNVSRDDNSGALEAFLRGLIVEEFAGAEPSQAVLDALATYVRAIGPCEGLEDEARTLSGQVGLVRDAATGAAWLARRGETPGAQVLISGARTQLGLIDERYAGGRLTSKRRLLREASRALQPVAEADEPDPEKIEGWLFDFDRRIVPGLEKVEHRSLYDEHRMENYLEGPG